MFKNLQQLDQTAIMESFTAILEENFRDFSPIRKKYLQAMQSLQTIFGEEAVQKEMEAIARQISSGALYCGMLGLQANYLYFANPVSGNFLSTDAEVYLRENIAHSLPEYTAAQQERSGFYDSLTPSQQELYLPVVEYVCYLETVVPKLAHYQGFLLGNELFPRIIPGYQPNMAFTIQYRVRVESFFGQKLNLNQKNSFSLC